MWSYDRGSDQALWAWEHVGHGTGACRPSRVCRRGCSEADRRRAARRFGACALAARRSAGRPACRPAGAFLVAKGAASLGWAERALRVGLGAARAHCRRQRPGSSSLILSRLTEVPKRQRAKPMDPSAADRAARAAEHARSLIEENAKHLSSVLNQTTEALGKTAAIAEEHARRRDRAGLSEAAPRGAPSGRARSRVRPACPFAGRGMAQARYTAYPVAPPDQP